MSAETGSLVFLLLLIGVGVGFALGFFQGRKGPVSLLGARGSYSSRIDSSSLIDELAEQKNDQDLDRLVTRLSADDEALETHVALGRLLRKRGETDKAVRLHQGLLAKTHLSKEQLNWVQLELAVDYQKSGLLDRAESLLRELSQGHSHDIKTKSLTRLVLLYQGQNDWVRAIDTADELDIRRLGHKNDHWSKVKCHFCCELAQIAIDKSDWKTAGEWFEKARIQQKNSIRLSLLEVQSTLNRLKSEDHPADPKLAKHLFSRLQSVSQGRPLFHSHVLPLIVACHKQFPALPVNGFLSQYYHTEPSEPLMLVLVELALRQNEHERAMAIILDEMANWPNLKLVSETLTEIKNRSDLELDLASLLNTMTEHIKELSRFECSHCGFVSSTHFWCCPTCKVWESLEPMVFS